MTAWRAAASTRKPKAPLIYNPKVRSIAYQVAAVRGDRVPGLERDQQRGRQPGARQDRVRLRLLGQHRRLRHQPDADRLFDHLDLWPRVLGRPAQHAAGRGARHRASRPSSASSSASRGCRRTGWWRKIAGVYVEIIRNMPLLLQLLFWYNAVLKALPDMRDSIAHSGRRLPQQSRPVPAAAGVPAGARRGADRARARRRRWRSRYRIWAKRRQMRDRPAGAGALGRRSALVDRAAARRAGAVRLSGRRSTIPKQGRFNIRGGIEVLPEFMALLFGLVDLHRGLHRRGGARRHPGGVARARPRRPIRSGLRPRPDAAAGGHAAGDARDHPAADQPVSQPDQELVARGRDRLSGPGADLRRHGAEPDRPGGRGHRHHHGGLSHHQPRHLGADELYNRRIALVER